MTDFQYDVAVSSVEYDDLTVKELARRLGSRLRGAIFTHGGSETEAERLALESTFRTKSRVLVVLYQRLWGETPATSIVADAIRARAAAPNGAGVRVLTLVREAVPRWIRGAAPPICIGDVGLDSAIEAIVSAVEDAGGEVREERAATATAREEEARAAEHKRDTFLGSHRAHSALRHELDLLAQEVINRVEEGEGFPEDLSPQLRRSPTRLTAQLGAIGLSFSWIAGRSGQIGDGRLLVIEWDGVIAVSQHAGAGVRTATPLREHVFRVDASNTDDWSWRDEATRVGSYSSRHLAWQHVHSAIVALRDAPPSDEPRVAVSGAR